MILIYLFAANLMMPASEAQTRFGVERLRAGIGAYERGEYDVAVFRLELALDRFSDEEKEYLWTVRLYLGLSHYLMGERDEAVKEFVRANEIIDQKRPDPDLYSPKVVLLYKGAQKPTNGGAASINLRSSSRPMSISQVQSMLNMSIREKTYRGFYGHSTVSHSYKKRSIRGDSVVVDTATGLMWHRSGSDKIMSWNNAKDWVKSLNRRWNKAKGWVKSLNSRGYAGCRDWRLPTVEEAASLLESSENNSGLYIDPVFTKEQEWIWTGDEYGSGGAWDVSFNNGSVLWNGVSSITMSVQFAPENDTLGYLVI